eukprot:TRINITY_DN9534_c0_g1_i1.p1 TRINITY_DN9534_c0_g1~~TRINITY_DN9534_c0_g1_i1.p1  ORF type:complete len:260 (+),score=63.08 TRINITY_DN9534_c0_g1_i1:176-955(+)
MVAAVCASSGVAAVAAAPSSSVQKTVQNVGAVKASFLSGRALRNSNVCASTSKTSVVARAAASEKPLSEWFDGSLPADLDLAKMCAQISGTRAFKKASVLAMNVLLAMPALAEEEKGKIFDFNLTLPIIAVQFLLLMVALDTIWFRPVAKVMDDRDENIRSKLLGVRDNSGEIKKLTDDAQALIKAARVETTIALSKTKRETAAELDAKLGESRARIEKELSQALSNLQQKKEDTLKSLDTQVAAISDEILQKVIPFKI